MNGNSNESLYIRNLESASPAASLASAVVATPIATAATALVHIVRSGAVIAVLLVASGAPAVTLLVVATKVLVPTSPAPSLVAPTPIATSLATTPTTLIAVPRIGVIPPTLVISIAS